MALLTGREYRRSLRDGRQVWISGQKVDDVTTHPALAPMVDAVAAIYDLHFNPAFAEEMTFSLPEGGRGSRFYKIPASREDLALRRRMTLSILREICPTMDRFGDETVTPLFLWTDRKELLDKYDPRYFKAAEGWLHRLQRENLFLTSGNTDAKGDRAKGPHEQDDPDLYLRVVKETDKGIVIRGAKFETGSSYAHIACLKPTVGQWVEANRDYAVSCIVELNAPGVKHICRAPLVAGGGSTANPLDKPLSARFDEVDTLMVFDDVLVPWENVLFSRHTELAALIRSEFPWWAAHGFLTRCLAKADLLVGTALLIAEQSGTIAIPAIRSKISQLMMFKETIQGFLLGSESACEATNRGFVRPNQAIQNAGRVYCSQTYSQMAHLLREICGGAAVMLPDRASFESPETGPWVSKFFRVGKHSADLRLRTLALAAELTASSYAGRVAAYQLFAETPVFAQENALFACFDREGAKRRALALIADPPADVAKAA
jgi:4-hydroxyphenylacetate 3-monooxygenase